ncbi:PREDICTED: UDP-glucuronosyltransferase 1-1-like [Gekko japonicus]|uniref:UDP-glucuronosyltransferase 1-1-like n=1 Tax=Gekko japonicus TaxID=146911 RepID=A0ABM1K6T7_GEKJA|nr:PREDICTED: UDP-glucuronosyltransferase 1-1-like [Gekko japonicus]
MFPMFHFQKEHVAALLLFMSSLNFTSGGKLLVVPMDGSHWLSMQSVLKQLKQNGHEAVVVAPETNMHIKPSDDLYTMKTYPVPFTQEELEETYRDAMNGVFEEIPFLVRFVRTYNRVKTTTALLYSTCTSLLYNQELMKYFEQSKFDALFTDPMMPCGQIVAEYLGIPSIFFLRGIPCGLDSEALQCPSPPSYVPRVFTTYTDHMTFAERVKNLLLRLSESFLCRFLYSPYSNLAAEFLQKDTTIKELLSHGSVWLMRADSAFDYPKPLMPNMVSIGGINCAWKKSLTQFSLLHRRNLSSIWLL